MKTYKVKLTKVRSSHSNVRTNEIEGETLDLPEAGKSFVLIGESLAFKGGGRIIETTLIEKVEKMDNEYLFHTANSTYKLEVLRKVKQLVGEI